MASFDSRYSPPDAVDEEFARKLVGQANRGRDELPAIEVDPETSDADLALAADLLGQRVQRRT